MARTRMAVADRPTFFSDPGYELVVRRRFYRLVAQKASRLLGVHFTELSKYEQGHKPTPKAVLDKARELWPL